MAPNLPFVPFPILTDTRDQPLVTFPGRRAIEKTAKKPRNPRIEALRLVAVAAIALFHTFQPWFSLATQSGPAGAVAVLGLINLLGAYGNHVFYMISGYFLLPAAIEKGVSPRKTMRRVLVIVLSVALYAALTLALDAFVPIEGVSLTSTSWLVGGLEFIWVYLALVALTPLIAAVARRLGNWRATVVAIVALVFAVNAYVAFFSPGEAERGLLEWRKLLSAATYLSAFLAGGALSGTSTPRRRSGRFLFAAIAVAIAVETGLAFAGRYDLVAATSFKSTSLLSFGLAILSLAFAVTEHDGRLSAQAEKAITTLAASTLGFYIPQSMTSGLWRPALEAVCAAALEAQGFVGFIAVGTVLSTAFAVLFLLFDRAVRIPLLKGIGLS